MWQGDEIYLCAVIDASRTEYFQGTRDARMNKVNNVVKAGLILLDFFLRSFTLMHCGMDNPWLQLSSVGGSSDITVTPSVTCMD